MILINGQIFIKKNPEIKKDLVLQEGTQLEFFSPSGVEGVELENREYNFEDLFNLMMGMIIETGTLIELDNKNYMFGDKILSKEKLMDDFRKFFIESGVIREKKYIDYFKNRGFYQVNITDSDIFLLNRAINVKTRIDVIEKLNSEFLSLDEYFSKALFVGRETVINGYSAVILYESNGIYIVNCNNCYLVINKDDVLVGNIPFGNIISNYIDKDALYKAIVNQEFINRENGNSADNLRRK